MNKYMSMKELSEMLGLTENSLRYHFRMGRIRPSLKVGSRLLFDPADVVRQLQRDIKY